MCTLVKQSTNSNSEFEFYSRNIKRNHPHPMLLYFYKWAAYFLIQYHSSSVIIQTTTMRVSFHNLYFFYIDFAKKALIFYIRHLVFFFKFIILSFMHFLSLLNKLSLYVMINRRLNFISTSNVQNSCHVIINITVDI